MKAHEAEIEAPHAPRIVHMCTHAGDLVVLDDQGALFRRIADPKDFNQGPHSRAKFLWIPIEGPHSPNV